MSINLKYLLTQVTTRQGKPPDHDRPMHKIWQLLVGIRIDDSGVVTHDGQELLTAPVPKIVAEMAALTTSVSPILSWLPRRDTPPPDLRPPP